MWVHWYCIKLIVGSPATDVAVIRDVVLQGEFCLIYLVQIVGQNVANGSVARPVALPRAAAGGFHPLGRILPGQSQDSLGLLVGDLRVVVLVD